MKKFLGTLKGKVVAILLVIAMVTGAGAVFASTGAGDQLRAWYDGMFGQTVDNIEADVTEYVENQVPAIESEFEEMKVDAGIDIDLSRELATGDSLEAIVEAKLAHIGELDGEMAAILEDIGLQFYNVMLDGYFQIGQQADSALNYANNDLTDYVGTLSDEAVGQMTTDINGARDIAVEELEEAIQAAQEALATELDTQQEITTRNLNNQVDWAINDLRDNVTSILENLVTDHQDIIIAAAQDLEADAISALDDVISGINE